MGKEEKAGAPAAAEPAAKESPKEEETQEKILNRFNSYKDLEKSYQELERKLSEQGSELGEMRKRSQSYEQAMDEMTRKYQAPASTSSQAPPDGKDDEQLFWDRPLEVIDSRLEKKVARIIEEKITPILRSGEAGAKQMFRQTLSKAESSFYDKYAAEIDGILSNFPPEMRSTPDAVKTAFTFVKGNHFEDAAQTLYGPPGGKPPVLEETTRSPEGDHEEELTNEQKGAARAFGMSDKEYKKWQKKSQIGRL